MTPQNLFDIVAIGRDALPCIVAGSAVLFPWPKRLPLKVMSAIFAGRVIATAFTIYVYNPAGIAASLAAGAHFPEMQFDNNTIAVAILGGWVYPAAAVAVVLGARSLIRKVRASPDLA